MLNDAQNRKLIGKLKRALEVFEPYVFTKIAQLPYTMYETADRLETVPDATLAAVPETRPTGKTWGGEGRYCWFLTQYTPPNELAGQPLYLYPELGGYEAMLWVNGEPYGTFATKIVVTRHGNHYCDCFTRAAVPGTPVQLAIEFYAGHYVIGEQPFEERPHRDFRFTADKISVCTKNQDVLDFILDLRVLLQLVEKLPETSFRRAEILNVLTQVHQVLYYDPTATDAETWHTSLAAARRVMAPALAQKNGGSAPTADLVGHSHIDTAWLWPMDETIKKIARTAANQFNLLDQYPEYRFIQSAAYHTWLMEQHYPQVFRQLQKRVADGRFELNGAVWVECDCNIPSGESLVRQFLWGTRYIRDKFGKEQRVFWLPDTFGYSAALPQIMQGFGVTGFLTTKLAWNDTNRFPYETFVWKGIDGSSVVAHFFVIDTWPDPAGLLERIEGIGYKDHIARKQAFPERLVAFGYGDGGGGPTRDDIEYAKREQNLEGAPRVELSDPKSFFKKMDEAGGPVNTYVGELYFNAHRGTYTSQAKVKQNNRRAEFALREMEMWGAFGLCKGNVYDSEKADALWKELLLNQFHDILPGSSIGRVYEEARKAVGGVIETANKQADIYMSQLVTKENENDVTLFNSFGFERKTVVELPEAFADGAKTFEGEEVFVEKTPFGVKAWVTIPPCGAVTLVPYKKKNVEQKAVLAEKTTDGIALENSQVRVKINKKGEVTSFVLKESGREFAADALNCFHFYKDVPRMFDAWDIDSNYREQELEGAFDVCTELVADGIEAVIKVTGKIGKSSYTQYIRLAKDSRRLEFDTTIDWKELHRLLKTSFPVAVYAENGINEMQFGYVMRPTHRSREYEKDRFEVCNHRYSALCDASHGAAVLNDCKYGISMNQNALELTLLRAAAAPEMRADNQVHHFTYAFTAWEGDFAGCDVVKQGYELNEKPRLVPGCVPTFSMASVKSGTVVLDTIKPALDRSGDLILRLYESKRAAGKAQILLNVDAKKAWLCDMLENKEQEIVIKDGMLELEFGAFQIQTIRLSIEEAMA